MQNVEKGCVLKLFEAKRYIILATIRIKKNTVDNE